MTTLMDEMATNRRYDFSPTVRDKTWGLHVCGVSCRLVPPRSRYQVYEPGAPVQWGGRVLRDYGLVYVTHGRGVFGTRAGGESRVSAGDMILLPPGIWHNCYPLAQTGWDEHWVLFNGAQALTLMQQFALPQPGGVLHPGVGGGLHELFALVAWHNGSQSKSGWRACNETVCHCARRGGRASEFNSA